MEKKIALIFILLFISLPCFAQQGTNKRFVINGEKVKYQGRIGTYYKIPAEQVNFMLWLNTVEEIESRKTEIKKEIIDLGSVEKFYQQLSDYRRCLVPVSGITDNFNDDTVFINVYGNDNRKKFRIFFNLADNGIYARDTHTKDKKITVGGKVIISTFTEEFYRIGKGKIKKGKFKAVFPKGTWFTYRYADWRKLFGKDSDYITIHIPKILEKPKFIYYRKVGEKNFRFKHL